MNKIPVSVVISAFNEEEKIVDCIESVSFADEIICIDNTSTDKTATLAKKHGATVFNRENNLMLNVNKNYGFTKAKHAWILSLDADERVSEELREEIISLFQNNQNNKDGYWIPRKNIIFGKWIEHTGWYPDYVLRLFKKTKGKFPEKHVHEMVNVNGEVGYLKQNIIHLNYQSILQFIKKTTMIYAPNEAEQKMANGYEFNYLDAVRFPLREFLSRFFAREGYKDGFHGFMLSTLMAFYHFVVFAYIWEKKSFVQVSDPSLMGELVSEGRRSYKEFMYWFYNEQIKNSSNVIKKTFYKLRRKLK